MKKAKEAVFTDMVSVLKRMVSIESERLIIRRIQKSDGEDMYDYARRPEVTRYLLWTPHPCREYTAAYISSIQRYYRCGQYFDYAVILKSENKMIGTCGFSRLDAANGCGEAGYVINPDYQNMGYATEALEAILSVGFRTLRLNRIEARYMTENKASLRVMEKCGMRLEGVHREMMLVNGAFRDIGICAILSKDYFKNEGEHPHSLPRVTFKEGFLGNFF